MPPIARHLMITLAAASLGGCGFKMAMSSPPGAGGTHAGGAGGSGGAAGGGTGGASGSGGTGGTGPVIIIDAGGDKTSNSSPDANCGAKTKMASKVPPDVLILLDRSGSMNDDINSQMCRPDGGMGASTGCGPDSKWAKITPAITQVVQETQADVNWGLKFFPDSSNSCSVSSTAAVPIAPNNGGAIAAAIMAATSTNGGVMSYNGTPTRAAAGGAATYLSTVMDTSKKYILLATDGLPTCAASGGTMADDSMAATTAIGDARTAGFPTFVVGIATSGAGPDMTLSNMANAGGLPRMGMPSYYPVMSAADLAAAIRTLIGVTASCTFQIGPPPTSDGSTSLDKIDVFGDGKTISRDTTHTDGYDYTDASMMSIQVYGPTCDKIMSGETQDVAVTFRCLII